MPKRTLIAAALAALAFATGPVPAAEPDAAAFATIATARELLAGGETDAAMLLLLEAAPLFDAANPPDALLVALDAAVEAASGRTVLPMPVGALPFDARDGLFLYDAASGDLYRFDPATGVTLAYDGTPGDSPVVALDSVPGGQLVVRRDLGIGLLDDAGGLEPLGQFPPFPGDYVPYEGFEIYPDGMVLWRFSGSMYLLDVASRAFGWADDAWGAYYTPEPTERVLIETSWEPEDGEVPGYRIRIDGDRLVLDPETFTPALAAEARFRNCFRAGRSATTAFNPHLLDKAWELTGYGIDSFSQENACRRFGESILVTSNWWLEGGDFRGDSFLSADGEVEQLGDWLDVGKDEFSWVGVADGEAPLVTAVQNRTVLAGRFGWDTFAFKVPERPAAARLYGTDLALVEPGRGRIVVYDLARSRPRAALFDTPMPVTDETPVRRLHQGTCVDDPNPVMLEATLADGAVAAIAPVEEYRRAPATLTLRHGDSETTHRFEACLQLSPDHDQLLAHDAAGVSFYSLAALAAGASPAEALTARLDGVFEQAFPVVANDTAFTTDGGTEVVRWEPREGSGWRRTRIYNGERRIFRFEPDGTGQRLIVEEYENPIGFAAFLWSVPARQRWVELSGSAVWIGSNYFLPDGTILERTWADPAPVLRLPSLEALLAEAAAALPAACAAPDPRQSPCWPDWL